VLVFIWVIHPFPDTNLLRQIRYYTLGEFLAWLAAEVMPWINNTAVKGFDAPKLRP